MAQKLTGIISGSPFAKGKSIEVIHTTTVYLMDRSIDVSPMLNDKMRLSTIAVKIK